MFSGISGLKGFQNSMDVIGNNISNVNTVGYKASRTTFQSMLLQTVVGAKSPQVGGRGGANALQIGLGAQLASVDKIMNQGSFQNTGKKTDLALQGDGFFVLSDGIQEYYSRAGNFVLDETGNFVQPSTGMKLQGWLAKVDPKSGKRYLDIDRPPSDLFIQAGMTMPAKATANMSVGGNLNSQVGIEPVTITVKNPNDPTKTYKVRFTFEKLPPFDTKRLFSGSTVKYTWKAEIVDWNAESPSELPVLDTEIGIIELNQFGQVEKFFKYSTASLAGEISDASSPPPLSFDTTIISGDGAQKTWFNYSPDGGSAVENAIRDLFDSDNNGIMEKIVTQVTYSLDSTLGTPEFSVSPALKDPDLATADTAGQITTVTLDGSVTPANGDKLTLSYYTQEDFVLETGKISYPISGPILESAGTTGVTQEDLVVRILNSAGVPGAPLLSDGTVFTYDASTGNVTFVDQTVLTGGAKVRIEYKTQESFVGDGSTSNFTLGKRSIYKPTIFGGTKVLEDSIEGELDLNFLVNESLQRVEFRTNYPGDDSGTGGDNHAAQYTISYANPSNTTSFDVINVEVASEVKAAVSIPKTGDIKFFDKNDTQNYVVGDYDSPKYTTSTRVYDSLGNAYTVFLEFQKIKENQWAWRAIEESGIVISYVDDQEKVYTPSPSDNNTIAGGVVEFDSGGRISAFKALLQNGQIDHETSITRIRFDPGEFVDDGAAPPPEEGATAVSAGLDFSDLVQFASEFSAAVTEQDGNAMGVLQNFAINTMGEVVGTFSNGMSDVLGQLALAIFNNPAGLVEIGNTLFMNSANSGLPMIGQAGVGGRGTVSPGVLEMSNVDLAEEFTGMVIVQRAFQANARTVTTVDQILQELVTLKR